jgi:hypothetical protein
MSEGRKKPRLWPWIAALLIGLPVLYVVSFATECWRWGCGTMTDWEYDTLQAIYDPLFWAAVHGPHPISDITSCFMDFFVELGYRTP